MKKIILTLGTIVSLSLFNLDAQTTPSKKTRQHTIGIIAGVYFNNFTERQPFWTQEYVVSGFYKFNRFALSVGFTSMENPVKVADQKGYIHGPCLSLSGDIISLKKIRIPLLVYLNYYKYSSTGTDVTSTYTWQNKGCKTGVDYMPFKFPLTLYLYGGIAVSSGMMTVFNQKGVYGSGSSKTVGIIDIGMKYSIFKKEKEK